MQQSSLIGGWSDPKPQFPLEIRELCDKVRPALENAYRKFTKYIPTKYIDQVVAGVQYIVKIEVDKGEYVHVKLFVPPTSDGKAEYVAFEPHHTADDPIKPF